nr:MAG TPA: hypothetical protein [Caudoviricetes sp.]
MTIFASTNAFFKTVTFLFLHLTVRLGAFLLKLVKK